MASKRRRNKNSKHAHDERQFTVRGVRRDPPDIRKLSKALIGLAMAEAERAAQAEQAARQTESAVTFKDGQQLGGTGDA